MLHNTLKSNSFLKSSSQLKSKKGLSSSSCLRNRTGLKPGKPLKSGSPLKSGASLAVHSYKKTSEDKTIDFAFPKNARIQNQKTIDSCRRPYCEICGSPCSNEPHHIVTRGAGGNDVPENLIQLCPVCHTKAHTGELRRDLLVKTVAKRLGRSLEEIENFLRRY